MSATDVILDGREGGEKKIGESPSDPYEWKLIWDKVRYFFPGFIFYGDVSREMSLSQPLSKFSVEDS